MWDEKVTRRTVISGVAATALVPGLGPTSANAYWPALITGINVLVALWNGFKMAEEAYARFFGNRRQPVKQEIERYYGPQTFIVQN